jgi:flagellar motor switch protein FliG
MARGKKEAELTGREKVAILLITIGPEKSADIFKHLTDDEIEELTLEIANVRKVTPEMKEKVLEEFYQICIAQEFITEGGINYAKDVLERALGSQKAVDVINKLTTSLQVRPFEFIRKADSSQILNFIQNEHPQTIALILAYLPSEQAGQLLSSLPQEKQADVARRIALMDRTSPEIIKEVEAVLESKLSTMVSQDYTSAGGLDSIVNIIQAVDRGTEKHIMEEMEINDAELSEEIRRKMFVFEDITSLDSRSIQRFMREVDNAQWSVSLKSASEELKEVIFGNMSKRLVEMIQEDMEFMGPVRVKDIEEAQQNIVNIIRRLEDEGEIIISRGGEVVV